MVNILKEQQEQNKKLLKEYEILAKLNLEVILKYSEKQSDEKITEVLNSDNWKERTGYSINEDGIGWVSDHWYRIKPMQHVKWRDEKVKEQEKELSLNRKLIEEQKAEIDKLKSENEENKHWKTRAEDAERDNEIHLLALETAGKERWTQKESSAKEIAEKNKKLKSSSEKISHLETRVEKLEEESSQKSRKIEKLSKQLTESETQNEDLKNLFNLNNKPLPALPVEEENKVSVKQNIFEQLKTKAKVKIQKLQRLIKKEKSYNQEMIAQVEVKYE